MNYHMIYEQLVKKAQVRVDDELRTEKHHIIPRSMGGSDKLYNLVEFSIREHCIAHLILVKRFPSNKSMIYAAKMTFNMAKVKPPLWLQKKFLAQAAIDKCGFTHSVEARRKMSEAHTRRKEEAPMLYWLEQSRRGRSSGGKRKKRNDTGIPKSEEHRANMSISAKNRERFPCSICGRMLTKPNLKRHEETHVL